MLLTVEPKEILKSITQHKLRNVLTGFGIAWGIFILMLMMGFGDSFQKGVFSLFKGYAESSIFVYGGETKLPHKGILEKKTIIFDEEFLRYSKTKFSEIEFISIEARSPEAMDMSYDENKNTGSIIGVQKDYFNIKKKTIIEGRSFNYNDYLSDKPICIISEDYKKILFKRKAKTIGEYINIGNNYFQVVGVSKQGSMFDFDSRSSVIIPYTYFKNLFNVNTSPRFMLALNNEADGKQFVSSFKMHLAKSFDFNPEDENAVYVESLSEGVEEFQSLFSGIKIFIWFVGFCILLTGIISVGNIMYVNINERTREIGIRKAIGATPRNILEMILIESVVLTSIAGFVGMFLVTW